MAKNFFELLGFSSDELADTMPDKIVQVCILQATAADSMLPCSLSSLH